MSLNQMFTRRAVAPGLAAFVVLVVTLAWSRGAGAASATTTGAVDQGGGSCQLTTAQQTKSSKAWLKMMPVFRHPRCQNCHGGIPKPLPERVQVAGKWQNGATIRHAGVVDMDTTDNNRTCEECHVEDWGNGLGAPNWANKSDEDLCRGMHIVFEKDAPRFLDHILRDGGAVPGFIKLGFAGKRGLIDGGLTIYETETGKKLVPEPPPGTHAQLVQLARAWVAAQGGSFVGDKNCGCVAPETGEVYSLEIQEIYDRGFPGFVVTDSVAMKVRIEDTTVTVFDIHNYPATARPQTVTSTPFTTAWIPDPVGLVNIVSGTGSIALDYPVEGTRMLKVDFTHSGTRYPAFLQTGPRNYRQESGGQETGGLPGSAQFELVPDKKVYVSGREGLLVVKLTLIFAPKPAK